MSIIRCTECEENKDSDFRAFYLINKQDICEDCFTETCCEECDNPTDKEVARDNCIEQCNCNK